MTARPPELDRRAWLAVSLARYQARRITAELARYDLEGALAGAATTRWSSTNPTTKNAPTASTAARWFPAMACDTVPNTRGPSTADDFPTMA